MKFDILGNTYIDKALKSMLAVLVFVVLFRS